MKYMDKKFVKIVAVPGNTDCHGCLFEKYDYCEDERIVMFNAGLNYCGDGYIYKLDVPSDTCE